MNPELHTANILLKRGVKVPIGAPLFLRIISFFIVRNLNFVIKDLRIETLLKISRLYLLMDIDKDKEFTVREAYEVLAKHQKKVTKILAYSMLDKDYLYFLVPVVSFIIRKKLSAKEISYLLQLIILYSGISDFTNTIRSVGAMKITTPMNLSQEKQTS